MAAAKSRICYSCGRSFTTRYCGLCGAEANISKSARDIVNERVMAVVSFLSDFAKAAFYVVFRPAKFTRAWSGTGHIGKLSPFVFLATLNGLTFLYKCWINLFHPAPSPVNPDSPKSVSDLVSLFGYRIVDRIWPESLKAAEADPGSYISKTEWIMSLTLWVGGILLGLAIWASSYPVSRQFRFVRNAGAVALSAIILTGFPFIALIRITQSSDILIYWFLLLGVHMVYHFQGINNFKKIRMLWRIPILVIFSYLAIFMYYKPITWLALLDIPK